MTHDAICVFCGKPFSRSRPIRGLTCSRKCGAQMFRTKPDEQRTCKWCGNTFECRPSSKVVFCSISCFNKSPYRGAPGVRDMVRKCEHCAKEYRRQPGQTKRRYCSDQCYKAARYGTHQYSLHIIPRGKGPTKPQRLNARTMKEAFPYCQRCGWREEPAILHVHHKNRNRRDRMIENLEVLCPNCHFTDHYRAGDWNRLGAITRARAKQQRTIITRLRLHP